MHTECGFPARTFLRSRYYVIGALFRTPFTLEEVLRTQLSIEGGDN